jgi:hypothetical protein
MVQSTVEEIKSVAGGDLHCILLDAERIKNNKKAAASIDENKNEASLVSLLGLISCLIRGRRCGGPKAGDPLRAGGLHHLRHESRLPA